MYDLPHTRNLFNRNLEELNRYLTNLDNYSIIQAALPIRLLIIDSPNIVERLNAESRRKILFKVNGEEWHDEGIEGLSVYRWREVAPLHPDFTLELKQQSFLTYECGIITGEKIRVIDVIKYYAYERGGIHLGKQDPDFDKIRDAFNLIKINGQVSTLDHTMRGIAQVIYRTLSEAKEHLLYGSTLE